MEELIAEAERIQSFLEITTSDEPNELAWRLTELNVYLARSGKMLADAKALQDIATAKYYEDNFEQIQALSPSLANKLIKASVSRENHLVKWVDRIHRSLVHQGDNLRTLVSLAKEQLKLTRNGY